MNLLIEKKLSHPTKTKTNHHKLILMLPTSQFQSQMGKNHKRLQQGPAFAIIAKLLSICSLKKEISVHSPIMFPQLMLESGLLYFLVESGQVQGQAGVGGRDWGILGGGGRGKKSTSASKTQYNLTILFLFRVSKWSFTSMLPPHSYILEL